MRDQGYRAEETEPLLRLSGVSFGYAVDQPILKGVDLELRGGLVLLLGPNGHGKSTLLKMLAGVERPDAGRVFVGPHDMWRDEASARRRLAYVPEHPDVTPYASVHEVLELAAALRREPMTRVPGVLEEVGLEPRLARRSIRELSKGQKRRVLLAAALLGRPPILLLDEPLDALDRGLRAVLCRRLERRAQEGLVVVVTHEIEPFAGVAGGAVAMRHGRASLFERLPNGAESRLKLFERLARGEGV